MGGWELEKRTCQCGCKQSWKCLPTSRCYYFSVTHMPGYLGLRLAPEVLRELGRLMRRVKKVVYEPVTDGVDATAAEAAPEDT